MTKQEMVLSLLTGALIMDLAPPGFGWERGLVALCIVVVMVVHLDEWVRN